MLVRFIPDGSYRRGSKDGVQCLIPSDIITQSGMTVKPTEPPDYDMIRDQFKIVDWSSTLYFDAEFDDAIFYFKELANNFDTGDIVAEVIGDENGFNSWNVGLVTTVEDDVMYTVSPWMIATVFSPNQNGAASLADAKSNGITIEKEKTYKHVDKKTQSLIFSGFEYPAASGNIFSLSPLAQQKWTNLFLGKDILTYPIRVTTADEGTDVSLADAADATAFYTAFIERARSVIDEGRDLKISISSETDFSGIMTRKTENNGRA